jgi:hypothetical protein
VDYAHVNKSAEIYKPKHHRSENPGYIAGKHLIFAMNEFNYNENEKSIIETVKRDINGFKIWGENKHSSL